MTSGLGGVGLTGGKTMVLALFRIVSRKTSNRNSVSVGPPAASGWNCAEKIGLDVWMMPSFERSFRFVNRGAQGWRSEASSIAKPWF